jgi:hypothetical protein
MGGLALAVAMAATMGGSARAAPACDDACLSAITDRYLAALAARDMKAAPLAPNVKVTENGQAMAPNEGLAATATGLGDYRQHFNDAETGETGALAVVLEHGFPDILSLRLKVRGGQITEVERVVVRGEPAGLTHPEALREDPIFDQVLAPKDQRSRAQMIGVMRAYLKAVSKPAPDSAVFDPACVRVEDGTVTAGDPKGSGLGKLSCGDQLTQLKQHTIEIRDARFPVVDTRRGVVHVIMFFDYSAAGLPTPPAPAPGAPKPKRGFGADPFTFLNAEVFKLEAGRVKLIQAVVLPVPYKMASGWPAGD